MSATGEIDCTPRTSALKAWASSNMGWVPSISELIDNAFDAGARNITITFGSKSFCIEDDGAGFSHLGALATFGDHMASSSPDAIGMYGVGATEALLWIGGESARITASSVVDGSRWTLNIDWRRMADAGWKLPAPRSEPVDGDGLARGTSIEIRDIAKTSFNTKNIAEQLGYQYAPALSDGRRISIQRGRGELVDVAPWSLPDLDPTSIIDQTIDVGADRVVRLRAGIVSNGTPNDRPGLTYTYRLRVIMGASFRGCGKYVPTRLAGVVELVSGWTLTKNKDGLSRDEEDEIAAAIYPVILPLIERSEKVSHSIQFNEMQSAVGAIVNDAVFGGAPDMKAVRDPGEKSGTSNPTGAGGKHKQASKTQPGRTFGGRRMHEAKIEFTDDWADGRPLGSVHPGDSTVLVRLRKNHPGIAAALHEGAHREVALYAIALLESHRVLGNENRFNFSPTEHHESAGRLWTAVARSTAGSVLFNGREVSRTAAE